MIHAKYGSRRVKKGSFLSSESLLPGEQVRFDYAKIKFISENDLRRRGKMWS